jgi:uncharacterized protein involved in outer membrane biogenesis
MQGRDLITLPWKRWLRWLIALLLAVGLYAAAGFWGVPALIRTQATSYVREDLHRTLRLGQVRFNPFTFALDIHDAAILEHGRTVAGLVRLHLDYQASSLFSGVHTLREVSLVQPYANAIILPDGHLNLAELLPKSEPDAPIPNVLIQAFAIRDGRVDFADRSHRLLPTKVLAPLSLSLRDLRTGGGRGRFRLDTRTEDGEGLAWQGQLSLQPVASSGHFVLNGLKASSVQEFLADALPMVLAAGQIDLAGDYNFAIPPGTGIQLDATLPKITLKDLAMRARDSKNDWVIVPTITVEGTRLSLARHQAEIAALKISGLKAQAWRETDGSINLVRLFMPAQPAAGKSMDMAGSSATTTTATPAPAMDWDLRLAELALSDGHVRFEDRSVRPVGKFDLAPLSVVVRGISLDMGKPVAVSASTGVNGTSSLRLAGEVVPSAPSADIKVEVSGLPLSSLLMYLPNYPDLVLHSGTIAASGTLSLQPQAAPGPLLRYDGTASIARFDLVEKASRQVLVAWDRLDLLGIALAHAPDSLRVKRITARRPQMHVVVMPDQTLNMTNILASPTPATTRPSTTTTKESMPVVDIGDIVLDGGSMEFADLSITPNFHARIEALRGNISDVSTTPDSIARIALAGHVIDRYSPVTIEGRLNPLAYDEMTDITMAFRNIELPVFNPYSGRYAGYAIAKGKLSTELHYTIDRRQLKADHHVIIDQLQWGQATASKDKVSLPIRLATALLKDVHGVIDLQLPVTGSLDDPKFRIGPVVWQIVKNLVVKVATAPFRFLGSMFKGAEDAQFVDFQPGSPELTDKVRKALPELANSLTDRPEVRLDIPAGPITEADLTALDERAFQSALARSRQGQRNASTPYEELDDADKIDALTALYRQEFQHPPTLPDFQPPTGAAKESAAPARAASVETTSPVSAPSPDKRKFSPVAATKAAIAGYRERQDARKQADVEWLQSQLRPRFKADPAEGAQLAQARAKAIQDALLAPGKLDPTRVFLDGSLSSVSEGGLTRLELQLR